ncbi:unnamed protein product (macronuclear) [Paramecium tetraurelia]|uniref:Uncharacterized protein n=1 Tax=Paramecium tetraurelia TaxID=5888 RepID=A0DW25_PARTE|nr:uncharacterized protein GSPATT00020895001 [Paramecium tetraurelia]CAK87242.1 unnamed protein product [Paramecium tetraurelia]|eukprot:XP_001454639.1 hypothetical protein (macronuclear) [Paramecium tetraurelia strain d4-2]
MFITMKGDLVELNKRNLVISRTPIDNHTKVQYKQEKLVINDKIVLNNFNKLFINRLDYAIKNYEIKLQQAIQQFICNRQEILKINQTDKKLVTRYIWINDNYQEIRYSDAPLTKNFKKIPINEISFQYQQSDDKIMKALKKYDLYPEYLLTITHKKKQLSVVFLSFRKLSAFILLCNWILKSRDLPQIEFSALQFLKFKLQYAAQQQGLPIKKYLLIQLNRMRTQLTLQNLKDKNSQVLESGQSSEKKKWSVQLTIKKSKQDSVEKENINKKITFS